VDVSDETELAFAGPLALAESVRQRQVSARELVELYLRRIDHLNPSLNAFRVTLAESALVAADAHDSRSGDDAGPLAGVPIAVKDDTPIEGQLATYGSRSPVTAQPQDAEQIRRLRAAGAIPIGITNVPELMLFPWTASDANGITRNPWDLSRTPGGSSGGSAAAVAAGLAAAATGSDGGGSIRIPAACCGLVGMKPTRGRVSWQPNGSGWFGLDTFAPLARTVADSALMLEVMQGTVEGDPFTVPASAGSLLDAARSEPAAPLRIAISRRLTPGSFARLSPDQRLAFDRTARLLSELGHHVEERDPAYGSAGIEFIETYLRGAHEEFGKLADPTVAERSTRQLAAIGGRVISAKRRDAVLAKRPRTIERITALWDEFDVLLTPGLARTAIAAEGGYGRSAIVALDKASHFMPWFPVFNLTGQPAISLPAGFGTDRLPLSIQLVGAIGAESTLYSLAGQIEAARPWAPDRPDLAQL
jgi:amidase